MSKQMLDLGLLVLTFVFLVFITIGNEDSVVRQSLFANALPEHLWHAKAIYKVMYDIGMGGLLSLIFYLLLVRIPENAKRRRIRHSLERQYKIFKQDCLYVIVGITDHLIDPDKVDELLDQKAFREYFTQRVLPSQDRWHVFLNNVDEAALLRIINAVDLFREEISFALSATEVSSDEAFQFFKRLSGVIHSIRSTELGYDEIKPLSRFLWTLFSGFDFVTGYRKEDLVAMMIRSI